MFLTPPLLSDQYFEKKAPPNLEIFFLCAEGNTTTKPTATGLSTTKKFGDNVCL